MKTNLKTSFFRIQFVFWLIMTVVFLFIPGCTFSEANQTVETPEPSGKIVLQWVSQDYRMNKKLVFVDGNGQNILYIADFNGSPVLSPDGNQIAVRCPARYDLSYQAYISKSICLLDIREGDESFRKFSEDLYNTLQNTPRLTLPEQCWQYQYSYMDDLSRYEGVLSITWAPQADALAVVCGDRLSSEVCFLSLWKEKPGAGIRLQQKVCLGLPGHQLMKINLWFPGHGRKNQKYFLWKGTLKNI